MLRQSGGKALHEWKPHLHPQQQKKAGVQYVTIDELFITFDVEKCVYIRSRPLII